ncbi:MAG: damage-inducible protein DinB [Planctomycetota bacterium]|nr:MAG: damage-inducible protein DinB [Planctomycetota bacterium]
MTYAELLSPEFVYEMQNTRKVLERVPDDKLDWRAHPKSNTIGWVASHLVEIPGWVEGTLTQPTWEMQPEGGERYRTPLLGSRDEMLEAFDRNVKAARKALSQTSDEAMKQSWSLLDQGKPVLTMPRADVLRYFILNHTVHHRAILTVYLRLNDIPVPGMYGPSGDE